jgi:hypothetical protein
MLWPRQTCPFGLPDESDDAAIGDIVAVSIGQVLRATATDIVDAPLPAHLAGLLRQLDQRERSERENVALRSKRALLRESKRRRSQPQPANRPAVASVVVADVVGPLMPVDQRRARASARPVSVSASS